MNEWMNEWIIIIIIIIIIDVIYRERILLLRALQFTTSEMFSAVSGIQTVTCPDEVQLAGCSTRQDRW